MAGRIYTVHHGFDGIMSDIGLIKYARIMLWGLKAHGCGRNCADRAELLLYRACCCRGLRGEVRAYCFRFEPATEPAAVCIAAT